MIKKIVNHNTAKSFTKYTVIGVFFTVLNIFLNWVFIDVIGLYSAIGASIVSVILFFGKFYIYVITNFLHNKFIGYIIVNVISMVLNVLLIWILIELFHIPTVYSSAAVVGVLFFARFAFFNLLKLTK